MLITSAPPPPYSRHLPPPISYLDSVRIYFLKFAHLIAQPYNSASEIKLLKLEELPNFNIPVLKAIENNAEKFMDTAGFRLVRSRRRKEVRIANKYIESWKKEKIKFYEPTWTGLFAVLRQIGQTSTATNIDTILRETSPSVEQLVEHKDPENGMYHMCGCNLHKCNIIMIFKQQWICS
jgi:hypothetical protein